MSLYSSLFGIQLISYNYPIQNQELFDKILPLSNTIHKETLGGIEYEFKIYDSKQFYISKYLLYNIADISHGQGYHTLLYVDKTEKFYIVHE